jgi:putative PIG3 family NAD(P)H quinone oxidoreductase
MKVIEIVNPGPANSLVISERPDPIPREGEVVARVRAAGVNRADLLQRAGKYPPPPEASDILGLEVSGVIESIGSGVSTWKIGDEVCALLAGGGYAERVAVPVGQLMKRPNRLSLVDSAAIPEAFITAYANLFAEGRLRSGEKVLIHGGASGVGTAAIQVARVRGASVSCTVGDDAKIARCVELGASSVINYKNADFGQKIPVWSSGGVDLILDIVGREYFERNLAVLAPRGRLVCIASMSGAKAELDIAVLMRKRLSIVGSVLRSRDLDEKARLVSEFTNSFFPLFETGELQPVVHTIMSFGEVENAHEMMRRSEHIGKILLEWR